MRVGGAWMSFGVKAGVGFSASACPPVVGDSGSGTLAGVSVGVIDATKEGARPSVWTANTKLAKPVTISVKATTRSLADAELLPHPAPPERVVVLGPDIGRGGDGGGSGGLITLMFWRVAFAPLWSPSICLSRNA